MAKKLAFFFDASACSGCKTCQVACKDKHDLGEGLRWRRIYEISGGDWQEHNGTWVQKIFSYHISMACNHCDDPICLKSCPNKAIWKREDGIVIIDQEKCMGCRYCEMACPYGAPQYDEKKGKMNKCHLCYDYLDQGLIPSCVAACPMRVLDIGEESQLRDKYGNRGNYFPLPDPEVCHPNMILNPHKDMQEGMPATMSVENWEEVKHA
jgi:anaerobic dimethyl sulfoxide reductase subunit B (iron-sulfur subunit)